MNISRNNAEAFFLDYYEGNLSQEQVAEMFAFLKANPDLRETFEAFGDVSITDSEFGIQNSESRTPDFSFLKKEIASDEHEQAGVWMIELIEETISDTDRAALEKYLEANPAKRKELELLQKTILTPDAADTFGDSSSLKRNLQVTPENFSYYAVSLVEGTISSEEKNLLEAFIQANPEFAGELELFQATKSGIQHSESGIDFSFLKKTPLVVTDANIRELLLAKSEGILSSPDEAAVDAFIARFPEYQRELVLLASTKLVPDTSVVFEGKQSLRRTQQNIAAGIFITDANIEEYAISAAEGLLSSEETKALNAFVAAHPQYKGMVAAYASARMQADTTIVFDDKESLKRRKGGFIWWTAGMRFSAAAVLVIVFGVYLFMQFGGNGINVTVDPLANNEDSLNNGNQKDPVVILPSDNSELATNDVVHNDQQLVRTNNHRNNHIIEVNSGNIEQMPSDFNPQRQNMNYTTAKADDGVEYSAAFLDALDKQPATTANKDEYVPVGQYAMRWMKNRIDGTDEQQQQVEDMLAANNPKNDQTDQPNDAKDGNVDGMDITQSAVNRVGLATGGKISMDRRNDGTYLHLWKYSVRVSK